MDIPILKQVGKILQFLKKWEVSYSLLKHGDILKDKLLFEEDLHSRG